jgi:hypothetical protein
VALVAAHGERAAAKTCYGRSSLGERRRIAPREHDARACFAERLRAPTPDAAARARDDRAKRL